MIEHFTSPTSLEAPSLEAASKDGSQALRQPDLCPHKCVAVVLYEKQDDDGFILYESRPISQYIAAKCPDQGTKGVLPTELKAAVLFQQASSVEISNFDDHASKLVFDKIFKPHFGLAFDQATYDRLLATLTAKLDAYDDILGKQKYLAGDELTLADLYHVPQGCMFLVAGTNVLETKPNVHRRFTEFSSRPSWLAVKHGIKGVA
ncbi:hypothetical protein NLJ89_g10935 [Agrocybe chaxingu]|uniref:glutathione transferase n=1 Tax=Agrocybe chaxingu TaxID=84603 RepID=A0A9W8JQW3_9AGAR|nr:hypothetical protein NLJ89_g10935 [Agrocybe chaxingu]